MAGPAGGAQFGEYFSGVVATLGADDDLAALECLDIERVLQRDLILGLGRCFAAGVGCGEENRLNQREVVLGLHTVHQDRAHHAAPTD